MRWSPYLAALIYIASLPALAVDDDSSIAAAIPQKPGACVGVKSLSPAAVEVAKILDLESLIDKIRDLKKSDGPSPEAVAFKQQFLAVIVRTLLEERSILSKIDAEMASSDERREKIDVARDRSVTMNNILNLFLSGALNITGNSVAFGNESHTVGNIIEVTAGTVNVLMSGRALTKEKGPRPLITKQEMNMLAKPLGFPVANTEEDYPPTIWAYLNGTVPGDGQTRLEDLIKRWHEDKNFIGEPGERAARLAGVATNFHLTSELLDTRRDMLNQLRTAVSKIEIELLELLKYIEQ
jgi:hypothetical protein